MLNRHPTQEHRLEIDARNATFRAFELSGKNLISTNHVNSDDVEAYLDMMGEKREDLEKTWIARRMELDQCLELQLFYRGGPIELINGNKADNSDTTCHKICVQIGNRRVGVTQ